MDERLTDIINLLDEAPLENIGTILDIGAGQGQIAKYLARQGRKVTCTGVKIESYVSNINALREKYGIEYFECDIYNMPFPNGSFDAVIMCHVLEHCPDVFRALGHDRRVLREGGLLLIFVPPQEDVVCAGHISLGWNVGQLMYVLLLNGFDVRTGNFIEYGYNVCGFIRRSERVLLELRFDRGDIAVLARENFFPLPIGKGDGGSDSFNGNVKSINWQNISKFRIASKRIDTTNNRFKQYGLEGIDRILPNKSKLQIGRFLKRLGNFLVRHSIDAPDRLT